MTPFAATEAVTRPTATQAARSGVQRGMAMVAGAAHGIASDGTASAGNLAENAVRMLEGSLLVRASGKLLKVADQTLGTLLDIRA